MFHLSSQYRKLPYFAVYIMLIQCYHFSLFYAGLINTAIMTYDYKVISLGAEYLMHTTYNLYGYARLKHN